MSGIIGHGIISSIQEGVTASHPWFQTYNDRRWQRYRGKLEIPDGVKIREVDLSSLRLDLQAAGT
jgi:hypothetical protein